MRESKNLGQYIIRPAISQYGKGFLWAASLEKALPRQSQGAGGGMGSERLIAVGDRRISQLEPLIAPSPPKQLEQGFVGKRMAWAQKGDYGSVAHRSLTSPTVGAAGAALDSTLSPLH